MSTYAYSLSLWIEHPDADLSEVPIVLGLKPARLWKNGDRVVTPKGHVVDDFYKKSYCSIKLVERTEGNLNSGFLTALNLLSPHKEYLEKLAVDGIVVKFFIGLFPDAHNMREVLDWRVLNQIADLKISLDLDFYAPDAPSDSVTDGAP